MVIKKSKAFYLLITAYFLLFTSCSFKKKIVPPVDLINKDTMGLIITDLTITEAALSNGLVSDTLKKLNVLSDYHISVQRFDSSFKYYSENPKKLKEVYAKVLENLNKK
jgi:hypothetical protein